MKCISTNFLCATTPRGNNLTVADLEPQHICCMTSGPNLEAVDCTQYLLNFVTHIVRLTSEFSGREKAQLFNDPLE